MLKKILIAVGFFCLFFSPVLILSFVAFTVFHQIILILSIAVLGWVAYYVSDLLSERDRLTREVFFHIYELKKAKETLQSCLATDTQTQAYNERLLDSRLTEECERARRYKRSVSILIVAMDSLAKLTKEYGTNLPEVIIQEVAEFLRENTRSVDIIIRKGEDRFVVILPETQLDPSRIVAERIRYAVDKKVFKIEGQAIKVTVSIGIIQFDSETHRDKEDVLRSLEETLGRARRVGPNQIAALTPSGLAEKGS